MPSDLFYFLTLLVTATTVVIVTHAARGRLTMAPLYAVAGILTMLVWQLLQLGWWARWGELKFDAAHSALIPALILGTLLAYAMDGVRAARAYVLVVTSTGLIAWGFAAFRDALGVLVPIPHVFFLAPPAHFAVLVGIAAGSLFSVLCYEAARRLRIPRWTALGTALLAGSLSELVMTSVFAYGPSVGVTNIQSQIVEYLISAAIPALAAFAYGLALRDVALLPVRPLSEMFMFWRTSESNLREAREHVLAANSVISELRHLNIELEQANRVNDLLVTHSPLAILQTDTSGRIVLSNPAAHRLFATSGAAMKGVDIKTLVVLPDGSAQSAADWASRGAWRRMELRSATSEEKVAETLVTKMLDPSGKVLGYQVLMRDITSEVLARRHAEIEQRVHGIHRTGRVVAHDFSHLLLGLQGAVQRAADSGDAADLEKAREAVKLGVQRGQEFLRQIGAGQSFGKPRLQETPLRGIVDEAAKICNAAAADKGVQLVMNPTPDYKVNVDSAQICRVFTNLLGNAVRATPRGGEIVIDCIAQRQFVTAQIRDTGEGMSPAQIELAFEPGFSSKGSGAGGLGLAISYLLVEAHGGALALESNPNGGITANVRLPLAAPLANEVGKGGLLLAVEDEQLADSLLASWERGGGHGAETRSEQELHSILLEEPENWDLIVTDRASNGWQAATNPTVIGLWPHKSDAELIRNGQRSPLQCQELLDWLRQTAFT